VETRSVFRRPSYSLIHSRFSDRSKLAVYHLRDAMRKERAVLETALQLTLFPLLKQVDPLLYNHLVVKAGLTLPTFAVSWIANWFATDVTDIAAASRLLDVFLVSHPAKPLYCAVAMLTCNRKRILQCEPVLQTVYAAVKNLPLMTAVVDEDNNAMDNCTVTSSATARTTAMANVEHVVATALDYMYVPWTFASIACYRNR
jgi:Rab-GTPase-TBC domain